MAFRIGMRNVRRARSRSVLIVLGLLVGTTIVSGSLVINDTVNAENVHFTYQAYGFTDEAVYNSSVTTPNAPYAFFPASLYGVLAQRAATDPEIAGTAPEIVATGSVFDRSNGIPETGVQLIGVNGNESGSLGPFVFDNGSTVAGPAPGSVLLDNELATNLGARAGDTLVVYGIAPAILTVEGIVRDDTRGGFLFGNNAFVTLATAQTLENASGLINFIAVTNTGSLTGGVAASTGVATFLNASLLALGSPDGLGAYPVLAMNLASAESAGSSIATLFLVLGLFSIIAGALLIVGIFVVLAEERKGEMGMLRAVGLPRRSLVYVYYFEGLVYSLASAVAGTFLGILVGYVLVLLYVDVLAAVPPNVATAVLQSFGVTPRSLVVAFVVGLLLTLVTIVAVSARVSRLNIVRAIRSVPEPAPTIRLYTRVALLGAALAVLGALLLAATRAGTGDISLPLVGFGLAVAGAGLVAARFVRNRYAFSAVGLTLIAWGGGTGFHTALLGGGHSGTIFAVFIEGIEMVIGAVLLFVSNSDLLVAGLTRLAGRSGRRVPLARVGLAYPRRRPVRSAVNFTIFAMVTFTIVAVAAFGAGLDAGLAKTVLAESGGYTFVGFTTSSAPELPALLRANATLSPEVSTVVPLVTGSVLAHLPGGGLYPDSLYAPPVGAPADENFYTTNQYNFTATGGGRSAASVWTELEGNASVAVVDSGYAPGQTNLGGSSTTHPTLALGSVVPIENPATHATTNVTVIGYLSQTFLSGFWVSPAVAASLGFSGLTGFLFGTRGGVSDVTVAQDLKRAFFAEGLVLYDFAQILRQAIQSVEGEVGLLEVFVALGLAVGIAGMGIVALRAVVERRNQIGMLRASGFTERMILGSFLLEYSYITLFGIAIGTALALWLYYNATLTNASGVFGVFVVPTATIVGILAVAYGLTIAAILGPSWKAARMPPAEAVRYSE